jgi:C4-type Zn-finger protein
MRTVHCSVCERDVPAVNRGYRVVGIGHVGDFWPNIYVCKECDNAGSVPVSVEAQPEVVAVAAAEDAMARDEVVLSKGMARLL